MFQPFYLYSSHNILYIFWSEIGVHDTSHNFFLCLCQLHEKFIHYETVQEYECDEEFSLMEPLVEILLSESV